jgi:ribonuclease-3
MPVFPSENLNEVIQIIVNFFNKFFRKKNKKNNQPSVISPASLEKAELSEVQKFQQKFHIEFSNIDLIKMALKHRSYLSISNESRVSSNERLEFLGDAVLDLIITQSLYDTFPKKTEGELSKVKSILVSKSVLADAAAKMSLGDLVLLNHGEEKTGGRQRKSILADVFEAIVGAIYLDQGLNTARDFVSKYLLMDFKKIVHKGLYRNYKSIFLEYCQSANKGFPSYNVIEEIGPDHAKEFVVQVFFDYQKMGEGRGKTKKIAEQRAAKQALSKLDIKKEAYENL